ncbi:hypothetical protein BDV59DRAFT_198440 [Aspergillus ambiguus]|uniref:uncharacterized protein n=1 Tax=Aspergillus ambiguus TaxID=176160 RepID=UPI003CCD10A5
MPPRKKEPLSAASAAAKSTTHKAEEGARKLHQKSITRVERIPPAVRFILVVLSSLIMSSTLFTLTSRATLGELGRVSKHLEEWWEVAGLMAWKAVEVGLAWILGFDGRDVTSFIFLTHLPTYALLASFYNVRPTSILLAYTITLVTTSLPFVLLRHPSAVHGDLAHSSIVNRAILQDRLTTIYTTVAATSIFTTVLYLSYATFLPTRLVLHFHDIPDITAVHAGPEGLPILFLALLPAGCAARDFLFVSSAGSAAASRTAEDDTAGASPAEREGEYLACAVYRKTWGRLPPKTKVLAGRTLVLAAVLLLNTVVQVAGTVDGVDIEGAAAWGGVWAVGTVVVGTLFGWIEGVDGM